MVDLRSKLIDIEQQEKLNSCVAHAVTSALEMALGDGVERSRMFLYYVLREAMGTQAVDSGAKLENVGEALIRTGCPPESLWPYDRNKTFIKPPQSVYDEAKKTTITKWSWVNSSWIKATLDRGIPVICAVYTRPTLRKIVGPIESHASQFDGYQDQVVTGAHAFLIVGYNDQGYLIANSFGTEYGDNGFLLMPEACLKTDFLAAISIEAKAAQQPAAPQVAVKDGGSTMLPVLAIAAVIVITKLLGLW